MKQVSLIIGMAGLLAAAPALAQPAHTTGSGTTAGQTMTAPDTKALAPLPNRQPRRVFTIFNMPVVVWAPIQPHYDTRSKLHPSSNPSWLDADNPM